MFHRHPSSFPPSPSRAKVVEILADLASKGKTVILSIHQPRYSVFKLFDVLMLLAEGEMVYQVPHPSPLPSLPFFSLPSTS